jgi:hypothetical protein
MSLHQRDSGIRVTAANLGDVTDPVVDTDPYLTVLEDLLVRTEFASGNDATAATGDDKVSKAFMAGQVVRTSQILAMFTQASITTVSPVSGPAVGGTAISIFGTGLDGVTGGTLGGTALTSVVVVNPRQVTAVAPAHAAGLVALVLTDDAGSAPLAGAFTYTA